MCCIDVWFLHYNIYQLQNKGIVTVQVLNQVDVKRNQAYNLATRRQETGEENEQVIYEDMYIWIIINSMKFYFDNYVCTDICELSH